MGKHGEKKSKKIRNFLYIYDHQGICDDCDKELETSKPFYCIDCKFKCHHISSF